MAYSNSSWIRGGVPKSQGAAANGAAHVWYRHGANDGSKWREVRQKATERNRMLGRSAASPRRCVAPACEGLLPLLLPCHTTPEKRVLGRSSTPAAADSRLAAPLDAHWPIALATSPQLIVARLSSCGAVGGAVGGDPVEWPPWKDRLQGVAHSGGGAGGGRRCRKLATRSMRAAPSANVSASSSTGSTYSAPKELCPKSPAHTSPTPSPYPRPLQTLSEEEREMRPLRSLLLPSFVALPI
mmetsp:Transcript_22611/g.51105  ORF Transcript_22611/g.51105 Transcript_22611/m.51105 type:complete len:241 (+) Transcript_22611:593-1315(+)